MQMFIKSLQLNISSTVFETEMGTFFHCSNNSSNKICSSQLLKLQQNPFTQINDNQWWCDEYSKFHVTPQNVA